MYDDVTLKKCPFCGGNADIWRMSGRYGYFMQVKCSVCDASSRTFYDGKEDKGEDDYTKWDTVAAQRAIEAWNRRVGDHSGQPDS